MIIILFTKVYVNDVMHSINKLTENTDSHFEITYIYLNKLDKIRKLDQNRMVLIVKK